MEDYNKEEILSKIDIKSVISTMDDIFLVVDYYGNIRYVNDSFKRMLGYKDEDVINKPFLELLFDICDNFEENSGKESEALFTENDVLKNYNTGIKAKNGEIIPFNISFSPVFREKDKSICGTVVIGRDMRRIVSIMKQLKEVNATLEDRVAERTKELKEANERLKEAQEKLILSEKMSAMSLLAGGISHEISNPIMAIVGFSEILMDRINDKENKELLSKIKEFAFQCMNIINKFCDFAMNPSNEFEDIFVNHIIEDVLILTKNKLKYDVEVIKEYADDLPPVKGEPNELQNVLVNVILNAKDAMPDGGKLFIKTYSENDYVVIKIKDTGAGIPKEILDNIFKPFFTTKSKAGTGLGLSVAQEIIRAHDGKIEIESELGKGTTVFIKLPVKKNN